MYQRGGKLVAKVVPDTKAATLSPLLAQYVTTNSRVYTDGWDYGDVNRHYTQMSVDHGIGFYGTTLTDESGNCTMICTNGIENAWSYLKRTLFETYYHISKKHLQLYVDEFAFRVNTRNIGDIDRFELFLPKVARIWQNK